MRNRFLLPILWIFLRNFPLSYPRKSQRNRLFLFLFVFSITSKTEYYRNQFRCDFFIRNRRDNLLDFFYAKIVHLTFSFAVLMETIMPFYSHYTTKLRIFQVLSHQITPWGVCIIRSLLRYIINTKCCISSSRRKIHAGAWWYARTASRPWWYTNAYLAKARYAFNDMPSLWLG